MKKTAIALSMICAAMAASAAAYAAPPQGVLAEIQSLSAQSQTQRQALTAETEKALAAGVDEKDVNAVLVMAGDRNYAAEDAGRFIKKLADVHGAGLPVKLLRDKILEGMSKQVPAANVIKVADSWHQALADSKNVVQGLEKKGLTYLKPQEKADLINQGAVLGRRFQGLNIVQELASAASKGGQGQYRAANIIAAAKVSEIMLMSGATPEQALALPGAGLKAGFNAARMQEMQGAALDQLRQGISVPDVISSLRAQFVPGHQPGHLPDHAPFGAPNPAPGSSWPGGTFPGGGLPGNSGPGGGMSPPAGGGAGSGPGSMAPTNGGFGATGAGGFDGSRF